MSGGRRYNSYRRRQVERILRALGSGGVVGLIRHLARTVKLRYDVGGLKGVFLLGGLGRGTGEMARDWDARARLNAKYFIAAEDWKTEEEFWVSGDHVVSEWVLHHVELAREATALEIGCGIGRLLKPMARRVTRVIGVEVSPEMARMGRAVFASVPSVEIMLADGRTLGGVSDGSVDFCYSFVVFQHLPDVEILNSYCREVARVLVAGGLFRFQTQCLEDSGDGRDVESGGTLMGIRLSRTLLARLLGDAGLRVLDMAGCRRAGAEDVWVTARRDPRPGETATTNVIHRPSSAEPTG